MELKDLQVRSFEHGDEIAVVKMWDNCGLIVPWNNPHLDIERKLKVAPDMFLVGCLNGRIIATVMAGYEGHRGWINYLAVQPEFRRKGLGRRMMQEAENRLRTAGCPKINLQVRRSNVSVIDFYKAIGFETDDVISLGKRLEIDDFTE